MALNLPNFLTLFRILLIPGMVAGIWLQSPAGHWIAFIFFAIAAVTDFFDGYIARAMKQQSAFGRFLDPVADKILVAAALLVLAGFDHIRGLVLLPALIILCREIMVSGLREYLGGLRVSVPVTQLSKWKTTLQLVAIGFLLVGDAGPAGFPTVLTGEVLLWAAALLTLITGYDYLRAGLRHMERSDRTTRTAGDAGGAETHRAARGSGAE